jgi:act minimal PKS chain-length factor (CLF/KS beta)
VSGTVVTGVGVVAPLGLGTEAFWRATLEGRRGIGRITRFDPSSYPVRLAGEVQGFAAADHVPSRVIPQTDHWTHMGLAAASFALADAEVDPAELPEYEMAVVTAASSGGTEFGQREMVNLWGKGRGFVGAYQSIAWFYAATTGQISIRHGMRGPCGVVATEQAGGLDALAQARRLLRDGTRIVVSGGADASLCPYGLVAQLSSGRISERADPERAYVPFDPEASGYVPGEGGALLIVEDADHAARRGAPRIYGEIAGYGVTFDPPPGSDRPPGLRRAIENALDEAGVQPADVDVVFADAAGVPELDQAEVAALTGVFGPRGVPVTAPKTMTGRLYAGGAALDTVTALLSIRDGVIPPTVGVRTAADELDLVLGGPRTRPPRRRGTAGALGQGDNGKERGMSEILMLVALLGNAVAVGVFCATVLGGVPLLLALPGEQYVYAHGFLATRYDPFMPITILVTALSDLALVVAGPGAAVRVLGGVAGLVMVSVITVSLTKNVPINHWVAEQDPGSLPADWTDRRSRWQRWNAVRSALAGGALAVNLTAAVILLL